jgi:hypothetical protein
MKDIIITAKKIKTELLTFFACFIVANLMNVYAIIAYKTAFIELITQAGYVFLFSVALYILWSLLRIIFYFARKLFKTN